MTLKNCLKRKKHTDTPAEKKKNGNKEVKKGRRKKYLHDDNDCRNVYAKGQQHWHMLLINYAGTLNS